MQVGWRGVVQSDAGFKAHLTTIQNYKDSCGHATWEATLSYAKKLTNKKIKIAFFSSTPQGGGVALMRHALVRLSRLMGVDLTWYGEWSTPAKKERIYRVRETDREPQSRSLALVSSVSPRTSTTSSRVLATRTSVCRTKKKPPSSTGSRITPTGTGSPRAVLCGLPRKAVLTWSS